MKRIALSAAALLTLWGCSGGGGGGGGGGTTPRVATTITLTTNTVSFNAVGARQVVRAVVRDQEGTVMPAAPLSWSSNATAVVVAQAAADSAALVSSANGSATVTVTSGAASSQVAAQVTQVPTAISVAGGAGQTALPGSAVAVSPSVLVVDGLGSPVVGASVTFAVTGGGGSVTGATQVTNASGVATVGTWTLGAAGPQLLSATVVGTAITTSISATAGGVAPPTATPTAGNNQAGMAGALVPAPPTVTVRDGSGNPLPGANVAFVVTSGGGSVTGGTTTTNAAGIATVGSWRLGTLAAPNELTATVTGAGLTTPLVVGFRAVGCSGGGGAGYGITLCFSTNMTTSQRAVFTNAAARWATLITGDVEDYISDEVLPAGSCGASPSLALDIDDLLIFAAVEDIDGAGSVLGSAGWCYRRDPGLPLIGLMRFDVADVNVLELDGSLNSVILHEMGHVIGIGTMWETAGLLLNKQPAGGGPERDVSFSGAQALIGFNNIGGTTYTGGAKVPVENTGGTGTVNSHWRESVLANELMTGYLNNGANPLSQLTVRSLADIGYVVNPAAADAFFLTLSLRADGAAPRGRLLENDVYNGPAYSIDRHGRRNRILRTQPVQ
jgi:hypothetical protein